MILPCVLLDRSVHRDPQQHSSSNGKSSFIRVISVGDDLSRPLPLSGSEGGFLLAPVEITSSSSDLCMEAGPNHVSSIHRTK